MKSSSYYDKSRIESLRKKMSHAANEDDRHRIHAFGMIDARLEDGEITWKEAQELKRNWDRRHGY